MTNDLPVAKMEYKTEDEIKDLKSKGAPLIEMKKRTILCPPAVLIRHGEWPGDVELVLTKEVVDRLAAKLSTVLTDQVESI